MFDGALLHEVVERLCSLPSESLASKRHVLLMGIDHTSEIYTPFTLIKEMMPNQCLRDPFRPQGVFSARGDSSTRTDPRLAGCVQLEAVPTVGNVTIIPFAGASSPGWMAPPERPP
jgi:hypothetical protein